MTSENRAVAVKKSGLGWVVDSFIDHAPQIVVTASGLLGVGLAALSPFLKTYGPIAWLGAGLAAAVGFTAVFALYTRLRVYLIRARHLELFQIQAVTVNPLRSSFEKERVRLADFFYPGVDVYANKTFRECEIVGPGAMALIGHGFLSGCGFIGCDIVAVRKAPVHTAAGFTNCQFDRCRFINVTMFIDANTAAELIKDSGGKATVIGING